MLLVVMSNFWTATASFSWRAVKTRQLEERPAKNGLARLRDGSYISILLSLSVERRQFSAPACNLELDLISYL